MKPHQYETLLERHPNNPILSACHWPYPIHSVFNPGATLLKDGTTLLLCRVEERSGLSHLCVARSKNGIDNWEIDKKPTMEREATKHPEELWGIEDPRITYVEELGKYVIAYTAYGKAGPGVALATTEDFKKFNRLGLVMQADDKDAALLPRRIGNDWALIHRPSTTQGAHIWISYSPDLTNWGGHVIALPAHKGGFWDANKIGLSPPLIETDKGWLLVYHGVRHNGAGVIYRVGLALMDKEKPDVCIRRGSAWIFGPETSYEMQGDVAMVVFPCGYTVMDDRDTIRFYYGAADTSIGLCTGSIKQMLAWLDREGYTPEEPAIWRPLTE